MPKRPPSRSDVATLDGPAAMMRGAGRRLKTLREMAKMSQQTAGELVGVGQSAWGRWEKGERMPDPYEISKVAARFRVTLDFVYRGKLDGIDRDLALYLAARHPDLVQNPPSDTAQSTGTAQVLRIQPTSRVSQA